jgi:antitoxin ParD1/3/4
VAITREQHAKIKAAIDRGDYASTSEVIRTALREWELKEEMRRLEGERLGRLWDEGIASGPSRERSIEDILEEAKARLTTLWDEGIASGRPVDGPRAMKRLRDKYAAMESGKPRKR